MISSATLATMASYCDDVVGGRLVACQSVVGACERHLRDLNRQSTSAFPFHFDATLAGLACDYFPLVLKHSIGRAAGLPFALEPWQVFGIGSIFGWVNDDTNARRFRKFYWSMARKNGKSCVGAGLALFCASLDINPTIRKPEPVAQVILSATKREQVEKVIFQEVMRMRDQSPSIEQRCQLANKQITFHHNAGSISCVGSDKSYDGLNPSLVLMDELHAWKHHHRDFYNTMLTGSGNRDQPIVGILTTAGDDKSYIWLDEYRHAKAVSLGDFVDDSLFALIYEVDPDDDPLDPSVWLKSNPNLNVSVQEEYLIDQANRATSKIGRNRFSRYHGNRLVSSTESAFDLDKWDACADDLSDWTEADAIGVGVDLGGRDDFAAWAVVARFVIDPDELDDSTDVDAVDKSSDDDHNADALTYRYECRAFVYIAEDSERDVEVEPFGTWINEDRIKRVKYPITEMKADIVDMSYELEFDALAFDPHNGQQFAEDLEQEGLLAARMPQTFSMFNEPLADFLQAMTDGRLKQDGCPVLRWCVGNAVACRDRQDRFMLDKRKSVDKIDPVVAIIMAHRSAMKAGGRSTDENLIIV